jgi:hypothetical protein
LYGLNITQQIGKVPEFRNAIIVSFFHDVTYIENVSSIPILTIKEESLENTKSYIPFL